MHSGYCLAELVNSFSIEFLQSAVLGAEEGSDRAVKQRLWALDVLPLWRDKVFNPRELEKGLAEQFKVENQRTGGSLWLHVPLCIPVCFLTAQTLELSD